MSERHRHQVVLVREWDTQMTGSGCCGRVSGRHGYLGDEETFAETRRDMEAMGEVYRALAATYGDRLEITVIDPRNFLALAVTVAAHAWRRGGWRRALGACWRTPRTAVVCDGEVLFRGIPRPQEAVTAVGARLRAEAPVARSGPMPGAAPGRG